MTALQLLILITLLFLKHFIVDFPLQKPRHYLNKGTYGHSGGIEHAGLHASFTMMVLIFFSWNIYPLAILTPVLIGVADGVIHYHIDWAKMNLNKRMGWGPTTHEQFWVLLGVDQLLHALTYLAFAFFVI